ncbi:MAG TPA: S-layer homology domain-containing protein [Thermoanaerobaculia bacterium]|nr:S-layer homology domain-containing protein [Thermoanaerobaculia bacterium]
MTRPFSGKLVAAAVAGAVLAGAVSVLGVCGPFTDVSDAVFCPFVLEIFYLGITTGTTATTYDPTGNVTRLQMAAFLSRTVDGVLKRGSRRAALDRFWTSQNETVLGLTTLPPGAQWVQSDGKDLWAPSFNGSGVIVRIQASDGRLLETWTGATSPEMPLVAMGRVFAVGFTSPNGSLYRLDPSQPAGSVTTVASNLGDRSNGIAFDGTRIWTANFGGGSNGSVSIVTPSASLPWTVTTVTTGFTSAYAALFDGSNVWVTDAASNNLFKLDANGAILQTVTTAGAAHLPVFDGSNIWVPTSASSVTVVRASSGAVLSILTGNGLGTAYAAAFDGERVLITNIFQDRVSLFKAADLSPLGSFSTGASTNPQGACSDGLNFWLIFNLPDQLARF